MSDRWFYTHDGWVHGPVSSITLRNLVESMGILPEDRIWPEGVDPREAIRAEAAMAFPTLPAVEAKDFEPTLAPAPDWLPNLGAALAAVRDLSALPPPPPADWLPDVSRLEKTSRATRGTGPDAPDHG